jgi:hypothetical protein
VNARSRPALISAFALIVLAACSGARGQLIEVRIGNVTIRAEVADTPQERGRGLSGRDSMAEDAGMLFVLESERQPGFWMQGMRFPLDFVWISGDRRVVDLTEDLPAPDPAAPAEFARITPSAPVRYVLEVNAGTIRRAGVALADAVSFEPDVPLEDAR